MEELDYIKELKLRYKDDKGTVRRLIAIEKKFLKINRFQERTGICVDIFFKALDKGICYKDGNIINHSHHLALTDSNHCLEFHILEEHFSTNRAFSVKLEDYGVTWALVGEEKLL